MYANYPLGLDENCSILIQAIIIALYLNINQVFQIKNVHTIFILKDKFFLEKKGEKCKSILLCERYFLQITVNSIIVVFQKGFCFRNSNTFLLWLPDQCVRGFQKIICSYIHRDQKNKNELNKNVNKYVCLYVCILKWVRIHQGTGSIMYVCICMLICMHVYVYICMYECSIYMYLFCMRARMYVRMHVCMYVCI